MKSLRVLIALALLALACGQTTMLGDEKAGDGSAGSGGNHQGGASGDGSAGASGSAGTGVGATAGLGGWGAADGGSATCTVVAPPPIPNPTPDQVEHVALIHDYCTSVVKQCPILGQIPPLWVHVHGQCSPDELILGCEEDTYEEYLNIADGCDAEWKAVLTCETNATLDTPDKCTSSDVGGGSSDSNLPCLSEKKAFNACLQVKWTEVKGSFTTCHYGWGVLSACTVICIVGNNTFTLDCFAKPGLPMICDCQVNGNHFNQEFIASGSNIYEPDCATAAQHAADGECANRLSCCFQYNDGKKDMCICGSDPKLIGQPTCQAAADLAKGTVVDICPQYEPQQPIGTCWPPPCQ